MDLTGGPRPLWIRVARVAKVARVARVARVPRVTTVARLGPVCCHGLFIINRSTVQLGDKELFGGMWLSSTLNSMLIETCFCFILNRGGHCSLQTRELGQTPLINIHM